MMRSLVPSRCPVCAHNVAAPFYDGGRQTLATLAWPRTAADARALPRRHLDFVQCPACSHVYNRSFEYFSVPYDEKPNLMFNRGIIWKDHLARTRDLVLQHLPRRPTVVEIGCGEGHFLRGLAEAREGRYVGFDRNGATQTGGVVDFHSRYFEPLTDLPAFAPDAVVIRHVLEHVTEPAALVEQLAWAAAGLSKPCRLFAEVPCIDRVFETDRLADFFYEHYSHFTGESFAALMCRAGRIDTFATGYDGEVVYALVTLGVRSDACVTADATTEFEARSQRNRAAISEQLRTLAASGRRIAIWGGTGKGAAFIHCYGADAVRFPIVVDSDLDKVGTHVPGTGQRIVFRDALKASPPDIVIIPTQWRARDILHEMAREGIVAGQVLIEHDGRLVDFHRDPHPYRGDASAPAASGTAERRPTEPVPAL